MRRNALADRVVGLLMVGFEGTTPSEVPADLIAGAAGCILFSRNLVNAEQTRALVHGVRSASEAGAPLIAIDQEGGPVSRLSFGTRTPPAMALGAADDAALTERVYHAIGAELAALDINFDFAPVADLNDTPRNEVIGVRSFGGANPTHVARHVEAAIRGLHAAGVGATAKHFPGHGSTDRDSHKELPVIALDTQAMAARSLAPFAAAIRAGVDAMMIAHAAYPSLDAGEGPATLSRTIVTGLLRDQLAFEGVIVSDALEMKGISAARSPADAAVGALRAGVDLLLYSEADTARAALDGLRRAVEDGSLESQPLEQSLERVGRLRARLERPAKSAAPEALEAQQHRIVAGEAAQRAITIVRDQNNRIPLKLGEAMRLFVVNFRRGAHSSSKQSSAFAKQLATGPARVVEQIRDPNPAGHEYKQLLMAAGSADAIIAVARDLAANPLQARAIADLAILEKPVVAIVAGNPYDADLLPPQMTVIATYGDDDLMLGAAAEVIAGRAKSSGKLPIVLTAGVVGSSVA